MPYWESNKGRNALFSPSSQLINHDAATQRVRGGPSRSYTHLMTAEAPLHPTRTDEVKGCRWEPGELSHDGHDPLHCPYSIREGKSAGNAPLAALAGEGEWENDGRDEWEKLVLSPTERGGEKNEDGCEKPHPGMKRGESLVNKMLEDMLIRHAQGKSVRVLGLEDDKLRSSHDVVDDQALRGEKRDNSGEEPSRALRPPLEHYQDDNRQKGSHEESGLEKFMTKIKEGLKTPSPSSRPGTPSHHDEEQHGLIQAMTKMHEGLSSPAPSERHHLSSGPEAFSIVDEDEKGRPRKSTETFLFAHDYEESKRSGKNMESLREALASTPPPEHHARPENHHHHKQREEESGFGKIISKIKEGFEHTLMGREAAGIFDPRFWERRVEPDNLRRTAKRGGKEMEEVKEGEG